MASTYTFDLLSDNFTTFQKTLFESWKHITTASIHPLKNEPYVAEIVIQSELPNPNNLKLCEHFTSSAYITKSGDVSVQGADYFWEVKTWLRKLQQAT